MAWIVRGGMPGAEIRGAVDCVAEASGDHGRLDRFVLWLMYQCQGCGAILAFAG